MSTTASGAEEEEEEVAGSREKGEEEVGEPGPGWGAAARWASLRARRPARTSRTLLRRTHTNTGGEVRWGEAATGQGAARKRLWQDWEGRNRGKWLHSGWLLLRLLLRLLLWRRLAGARGRCGRRHPHLVRVLGTKTGEVSASARVRRNWRRFCQRATM